MSYYHPGKFGPERFQCKHKTLKKDKFTSQYKCKDCDKPFTVIPANNGIILPTNPPLYPDKPPRNPDFPDYDPNIRYKM